MLRVEPTAHAATPFVNVTGSFAIGVVVGVAQTRSDLHLILRYFLATGILGGDATFSSEAFSFATTGFTSLSIAYVVAGIVLAIG